MPEDNPNTSSINISWLDTLITGIRVTGDALDDFRAAKSPDSPGGTTVTRDELIQIGGRVVIHLADAAGVEVEIADAD